MQKMRLTIIIEFQGDGYTGITVIVLPIKKVNNVN